VTASGASWFVVKRWAGRGGPLWDGWATWRAGSVGMPLGICVRLATEEVVERKVKQSEATWRANWGRNVAKTGKISDQGGRVTCL
jgi:hypothetical protein